VKRNPGAASVHNPNFRVAQSSTDGSAATTRQTAGIHLKIVRAQKNQVGFYCHLYGDALLTCVAILVTNRRISLIEGRIPDAI
jgi:hypothetical protein